MHKLNVAYNNAFRFMHHLPTYCSASLMVVVNRVPNCRAVIRNRIYGFMKRLVSSSNAGLDIGYVPAGPHAFFR